MDRTINILIDDNDIKIDNHRLLIYSKHYLNVVVVYNIHNDILIIKYLQTNYQREDNINLSFELNDNDTTLKLDNIKEYYNTIIGKYPQFKSELSSLPSNDDYSKFIIYYVVGTSLILSLFGLLSNDKESLLLQPLHLVFPDIKIDFNILNPRLYHFLQYYIDTLKNMSLDEPFDKTILKYWLEFINKFFDYTGGFHNLNIHDDDKERHEDMLCVHASNLGYGKYLEYRIKIAMDNHLKFKEDLDLLSTDKQKELKRYYDDEILGIMEQTANIKNINNEIITDTTNFIKRNKDEVLIHFEQMKESFDTETRKKLSLFLDEKSKDILNNFHQISKKASNDLSINVINLENKQVLKIKEILNNVLDRKTGVIKELNETKIDIITKLQDFRTECKKELTDCKKDAVNTLDSNLKQGISQISGLQSRLEMLENEINSKVENLDQLMVRLNEKVSSIDNIKNNTYEKYMEEIWSQIEPELKKKSKIIIQSSFDEILDTLGVAIDQQINKKIENRLKSKK